MFYSFKSFCGRDIKSQLLDLDTNTAADAEQ